MNLAIHQIQKIIEEPSLKKINPNLRFLERLRTYTYFSCLDLRTRTVGLIKAISIPIKSDFSYPYFLENLPMPPIMSRTIQSDLNVPFVKELASIRYSKLETLANPLARDLSTAHIPGNPRRRLKRA